MIFTSDKQQFAPEELRTAFADLVQEVIDSRDPAEGAESQYTLWRYPPVGDPRYSCAKGRLISHR